MQREKEARENSRTDGKKLDSFGSFGFHGSMFPSIFGGKDPFDDPFFSRPYGSLFGSDRSSSSSSDNLQQPMINPKGPVIEELDSDAEGAPEHDENDVGSVAWTNRNPLVEHPEDEGNDRGKSDSKTRKIGDLSFTTNQNKVEAKKPQSRSVSFQRVTYGGINGAYYTATTSRRTGDDGVTLEERKQADRTTGQAAHSVSRGIHDKGLSVTRKLDSDGKVDTVQTLQNLDEDELEGFEEAWGGIADNHFHGWKDAFDFPGLSGGGSNRLGPLAVLPDPFREFGGRSFNQKPQERSTNGRPKKIVTINIE